MGYFDNLKIKWRIGKRISAFERAKEQGLNDQQARAYAEELYPSTLEELKFEEEERRKLQKNS